MAHPLEGESPLRARQGEALAKRQKYNCEVMFEGSRRQSTGLTNRNLMRPFSWISRHTPAKSYTWPETTAVNEAGISVKVGRLTRGGLILCIFFNAIWIEIFEEGVW